MSVSFPLHPRITLAAAALGFVVVLLDVSVVNVALDALRTSFSTDVAGLQWVVNAYTLVFAALLLMAGALGDRFGARAIFITGFVLFTFASLGCGLAPTLATLVTARLSRKASAPRCWSRTRCRCSSRLFPTRNSGTARSAGGGPQAALRWRPAR
ncbi:MFS transporter [Neorhizobium galegae]|uniref:MFS transporter n=1 Tax=Neorhizobium galegae TaxID=399 RepID=UPI0021065005|nr:MFS transporter [Neorhizobium galegae]MCQ1773700.1 MFS transporter [Neorhizobium galegae]